MATPLRVSRDGVRLSCRVTPKSSRDAIDGLYKAADGKVFLKIKVRAVPEGGKANDAVIKLLARKTGLARSTMRVISGGQSRQKVILVEGEPADLEASLGGLLEEWRDQGA